MAHRGVCGAAVAAGPSQPALGKRNFVRCAPLQRRHVRRAAAAAADDAGTRKPEWLETVVAASIRAAARGEWNYFAFGANLSPSVLEGRRCVRARAQAPGVVADYRLAFNLLGLPPEPAFASIEPAPGQAVHGCVFTLDFGNWQRVCRTEGVPIGYVPQPVLVELYDGSSVEALALRVSPVFRAPAWAETAPSARYATLIRDGAARRGLRAEWQREVERLTGLQSSGS